MDKWVTTDYVDHGDRIVAISNRIADLHVGHVAHIELHEDGYALRLETTSKVRQDAEQIRGFPTLEAAMAAGELLLWHV